MPNEELVAIIHLPLNQFKEKFKDWELKYFTQKPDLTGASLSDADLRGKTLNSFVFEGADLHHADLSGADLSLANMKGANLSHCKLENCDLSGCVLEGANLSSAVLKNVKWKDANLRDANLHGAFIEQEVVVVTETDKLKQEQLEQACNWPLANYDAALLADPNLPFSKRGIGPGHNNRLLPHYRDLSEYDLSNVNLRGANLANFTLKETNFHGAILNGAEGLEGKQLEQTRNWPLANYDVAQLTDPNLPFHKRGIGPDHNERLHSGNRDLSGYDLSNVNLRGANLTNFTLKETNLQRATLKKATGLTKKQIEQAVNWPLAYYDPEQLREFGFFKDHNARLRAKNLSKYTLSGVSLKGANLYEFNLYKTVLTGAQLEGANLQKAVLVEANLQDANLQGANLEHANLRRAQLQRANLSAPDHQMDATTVSKREHIPRSVKGANLYKANFKEAFLANANLEAATGLLPEQLAGASVAGAALPKDIHAKFKKLEGMEETTKNARTLFFILLLGCLYALITIAATTDAQLVNNSASLVLPIFNAKIPVVSFYFLAPLLLIGIYFVFNLSLQRLWERLAKLPAIFPDGTPLDEKAHPWLLIGLVRSKLFQLKSQANRPLLAAPQNFLYSFLVWGVVPLTLTFFWWRYLSRHDWFWTVAQLLLIAIASAIAVFFGKVARTTLRGEKNIAKQALIGCSCGLLIFACYSFLSFGAIEGVRPGYDAETDKVQMADFLSWLPWTYALLHLDPFAELKDEELSTKLENWTEKSHLARIKGASLKGRDLRYGNLRNTFLVKADLSNAKLSKADLSGADLRLANLTGADLEGAKLFGANLEGADLKNVKGLTQAQLLTAKKGLEVQPPPEKIASQPDPKPTVPQRALPPTAKMDQEVESPPEKIASQPDPKPPVPQRALPPTAKMDQEVESPPEKIASQPDPKPTVQRELLPTVKMDQEVEPPPEKIASQPDPMPLCPRGISPRQLKWIKRSNHLQKRLRLNPILCLLCPRGISPRQLKWIKRSNHLQKRSRLNLILSLQCNSETLLSKNQSLQKRSSS